MGSGIPGAAAAPDDLSSDADLLRQIVEQAPQGILVTTPAGRVRLVNPAACALLGYERGELLERSWQNLLRGDAGAPDPLHLTDLPPGSVRHHLGLMRHQDGHELSVAITTRRLADGCVLHMLSAPTTQPPADARQRASEEPYRTMVEAAEDAIFLLHPDETVQHVNPAGARFLDLTPDVIIGRPYAEFLPPTIAEQQRQHIQQVFATGTLHTGEFVIPTAHGERWMSTTLVPLKTPAATVAAVVGIARDITAQKHTEEALRLSEARFRTVVIHAQPIIFMIDRDGTFLLSEGKMLAALGLKPGQVVGQSAFTLYQDYPAILYGLQTALAGEHVEDTIDVGGVVFDIFYTPYRAADGAVIGVIGMAVDITERRQAEAALRERETQLRLANEAGDIGTWRHDIATGRILFDARGRAHYGFDHDTATLAEVLARIHPDDTARLEQEIAATIDPASDGSYRTEYRVLHPDGSHHWLAIQARVYFAGEGNARRSMLGFGTSQEITARKQADQALRESEARFRAITEQLRDVVFLADPAGRLTYISPAAHTIFGTIPAALIGQPFAALLAADAISSTLAAFQATLDGATIIRNRELRMRRADGSTFSGELNGVPFARDGAAGVLGVIRDISERKAAEVALQTERASLAQRVVERTAELSRANAALVAAVKAKDEFLANMSHELRTPLTTILGRTELLREQIYGPLTEPQGTAIHSIAASGQHLLTLINDILDLAKIEAGKIELQLAPVDVDLLCQQSRQLVVERATRKRITLTTTLDPQVTSIQADALRLKQILVNLLTNAVKFTPEGGEVGLEVEGDPERQTATFTVWDTGIGIAPEDQGRLFQPFVQLDSALNREYTGTGLGLALVLRLAERHGGSVALESTLGAGSRFSVTLPWTWPEHAGSMPAPPADGAELPLGVGGPAEPGARPVILLAEDHEANLQILHDALAAAGYAVVVARNGMEAVALAVDQHPALIVMDIQMPVLDGLEAIRRIRASGLHTTPIIALTALAMRGDRERCLAAGADDYLTKPVHLRTLMARIAAHRQPQAGQATAPPDGDEASAPA
ncbi:MAG: PAS domain S-box protein [Chloroflexales bacterium]|nr:PAS domain S-box protein [Chloroflexales bacterium]